MVSIFPAIISIAIAEVVGAIAAIFTSLSSLTWYKTLLKPAWNPPSWLFAPVWIILYALMGLAASLIWLKRDMPGAKLALWVYIIQLALNGLWSYLFFGLRNPKLAFFEIVILLVLIVIATILFWRINSWAGILMLPYALWVFYATYLNYSLWILNDV